jgi:uncharacterized membrane protein YraQ (UPF0718 family)
MNIEKRRLKSDVIKSAKSLWKSFPSIIGTILLISLITTIVPKEFYIKIFNKSDFLSPFIGSLIGSISAGTPITSYILGGEFLNQGVDLLAVTAFLVAWVTVGVIQMPAESSILGRKFAIYRNITAFVLSIIVALIVISILSFI